MSAEVGGNVADGDAPIRVGIPRLQRTLLNMGADSLPPLAPRRLMQGETCIRMEIERKNLLRDRILVVRTDLERSIEQPDCSGQVALSREANAQKAHSHFRRRVLLQHLVAAGH